MFVLCVVSELLPSEQRAEKIEAKNGKVYRVLRPIYCRGYNSSA